MTNREKALKLINEYLAKQEPQKVELALDSELKSIEQKAQSIFNDGRRDAEQEVLNGAGKMEQAKRKLQKLLKEIDDAYARGKRVAKDIGVDLDSTTVGKNFKEAFSDVNDYIISSQKRIDKLRKFRL
tara:strand:+ start:991 stop:1374 length:384 start_codon:yes stop_codon:yes gene_type:complete